MKTILKIIAIIILSYAAYMFGYELGNYSHTLCYGEGNFNYALGGGKSQAHANYELKK
jgi:hypothetical protein